MPNFFARRRDELELTQKQIADAAEYTSYAAVSAWEREVAAPGIIEAPKLAKAYRVTEEQMIREIVALGRRVAARKERELAAKPA